MPQALFWTLEAGFVLTLALLLWVAQALRRWPGGPPWLRLYDGGGTLRGLLHGLLMIAMGTVAALALLVVGFQVGPFASRPLDGTTLFNLELAGLLLTSSLHLVLSCLRPRHRQTPAARPPLPRSQQQTRREDTRWKR